MTTRTAIRQFAIVICAWTPATAVFSGEAVLFSDDFDAGVSGVNWSTVSHAGDFTADFGFDYSTRGIASAPNSSGGSTIGLHLAVNNTDAVAATEAVSAYPVGLSLSGDYVLRFDLWINYNGGPGGGTGSTEFATFGLGHSGLQVVWANNASSDGHWFAVNGEGGATNDYLAYRAAASLPVDGGVFAAVSQNHTDAFYQTFFTSPTFETQGAPGKRWVQVEIGFVGGVLEWRIDGRLFAIRAEPVPATGNIMLGCMDTFSSIANPVADNFVIFDNVRVVAADCDNDGVADAGELSAATQLDCNANGIPDDCETAAESDFENDGDVDEDDLTALADCFGGPDSAASPTDPNCQAHCLGAFDANIDGRIDLIDFATFQGNLTVGVFPARPAAAPTGSQFLAEIAGMTRANREARMLAEITGGNVPGFLRSFVPVTVSANVDGNLRQATYFVTPDYLAIGVDRDFFRAPMSPLIAQPIADALDCIMPTRKMVNDIYAQAAVKLAPSPISPTTTDIARATTFYRHHQTVEAQRSGQPLGGLIGGIKKDVVITPLLSSNPNRVAIYGWHQLNGLPIQPLFLGHVDFYADYSHGIRLVQREMLLDGAPVRIEDVLADPGLHVLLSDEGVVANPSY